MGYSDTIRNVYQDQIEEIKNAGLFKQERYHPFHSGGRH